MAVTPKMNFLTLVSYLLPNTFGGLSRTIRAVLGERITIKPLKTAAESENSLSPDFGQSNFSKFDRTFLRILSSEFLQMFRIPRRQKRLPISRKSPG